MDSVIMTHQQGNAGSRSKYRLRSSMLSHSSKERIMHHTFPKISNPNRRCLYGRDRQTAITLVFANTKTIQRSTGDVRKSFIRLDSTVKALKSTKKHKPLKNVVKEVDFQSTIDDSRDEIFHHISTHFECTLSREAQEVWCARVGPRHTRAPADSLQSLFNDLNLFPSKAQVFEMMVFARQCARRTDLAMTFGEFCFLSAQLRRHTLKRTLSSKSDTAHNLPLHHPEAKNTTCQPADNGCSNPLVGNQAPSSCDTGSQQESNQTQHPYEVFLGGSCNPTTWRYDIAIPELEKMGITYFNPQVADWSLELIEIEHRAKQSARVLFFVMDADTRAAAAAVEAAHLAAVPRPLVLVLQPYHRGQRIGGEVVTDQEYLDLSRGQAILQEVAERRNVPVFTELKSALRYTHQLLRGGRPYNPNATTPSIGGHLKKAREAFDAANEGKTGKLSPMQAMTALQSYTGVELSLAHIENLIEMLMSQNSKGDQSVQSGRVKNSDAQTQDVTFELFCLLVAEVTEEMDQVSNVDTKCNVTRSMEDVPAMLRNTKKQHFADTSQSFGRKNSGRQKQQQRNEDTENTPSSTETATNNRVGLAKGRKLSVIIPKVLTDMGSAALTPQTTQRLEGLAFSVRDEPQARDVYLGGSCIVRTTWREDVVIPMLKKHNLTYYKPEMNDYNRIFSAPPYTPANGGKFSFEGVHRQNSNSGKSLHGRTSNGNSDSNSGRLNKSDSFRNTTKHERSSNTTYEEDQPEKKPKYCSQETSELDGSEDMFDDVEVRRKEGPYPLQSDNRLSASDFYKISDNATPDPFRGMLDDRQVHGSRVLLFGVTSDTRCLSPMVLASHCIGLRPRSVVLCVQLLQHTEGLSERAVKDYNRGRLYLKDLALREGVPVYDNIEEATQCVIRKLSTGDY